MIGHKDLDDITPRDRAEIMVCLSCKVDGGCDPKSALCQVSVSKKESKPVRQRNSSEETRAHLRAYYKKNRDAIRVRNAAYRLKNRDKINSRAREAAAAKRHID